MREGEWERKECTGEGKWENERHREKQWGVGQRKSWREREQEMERETGEWESVCGRLRGRRKWENERRREWERETEIGGVGE